MIKTRCNKADKYFKKRVRQTAIFVGAFAISSSALALRFEPSDDVSIDVDTTLAYGAMWRVSDRNGDRLSPSKPIDQWLAPPNTIDDPAYIESVLKWNSDDGNRNFDKGDMVSSRFAATTDFDISYKNVGVFFRTQIFYDSVYYEENDWSGTGWDDWQNYIGPESINNVYATQQIDNPNHFSPGVRDVHGSDARFLDAYVYGTFEIGDRLLDLRIGRQVISWGESLMRQGGISFAQNRIDASAATSPGVELKEIFLPTGSVYGQIDLTDSLTMEAYWQYEHIESQLLEPGSYWAAQDFIGNSGQVFLTNAEIGPNCMYGFDTYYGVSNDVACFVPLTGTDANKLIGKEHTTSINGMVRVEDKRPEDEGDQWGVAFRYLLENGSEFGVYGLRYHDRYPSVWSANNGGILSTVDDDVSGALGVSTTDAPGFNVQKYTIEYEEAIRLYGLTLNTVIADVQMGFEIAYRPNQPVVPGCSLDQLNSGSVSQDPSLFDPDPFGSPSGFNPNTFRMRETFTSDCKDPSANYQAAKKGIDVFFADPTDATSEVLYTWKGSSDKLFAWPTRAEVFTYNIGVTMVVPPTPFWDTGIFVSEFGGFYVGGFEDEDLRVTDIGGFTKQGYGISAIFLPEYKNVMQGVDLTVPIFFDYTIDGSFSYFNYNEHALWWSIGLNAIYLDSTTIGLNYNSFHGSRHMWRDRDNISFNIKYTF